MSLVPQPQPAAPLHGVAPLTALGVIRAHGEEAAAFLHGQLTQDLLLLPVGQARLAAFCSAKGRMLASFVVLKTRADEVLLVCSRDLLAATLKRLSMFVLRAKLKLSDASADYQLAGLIGAALDPYPALAAAPWAALDLGTPSSAAGAEAGPLNPQGYLVRLYPAAGQPRALWLAPHGAALPVRPAQTDGPALTEADWAWSEVHSGVATLSAPLAEAFVPQMLNYESVGGVNFKKGCYPGQEVVARSQFRGTLKRRAYLVHGTDALHAGQELFSPADPEQACGLVVQVAAARQGGCDALVSVQIASVEQGLHAGSASGPRLSVLPLPYALLDDI